MWVLAIVGVCVVILVIRARSKARHSEVTRSPSRGRSSALSTSSWDNMLQDPNLDAVMADGLETRCFTTAITKVLRPLGVDYMKFTSNLFYLMGNGSRDQIAMIPNSNIYNRHTPSVQPLADFSKRPVGMPIWVVAAFPDVFVWANGAGYASDPEKVLYSGISSDVPERAGSEGDDSPSMMTIYRKMAENYSAHTRRKLETC